MSNKKFLLQNIITVTAVSLLVFAGAKAGNLEPGADPSATMYTLSDIYERLTTNAEATEGDHDFAPSADPASSMFSLAEIYDAIPTIDSEKVKLGTEYLGIDGELIPDGGNATPAQVLNGQTFFGSGQANWNLQTGTMTNVGSQTIVPAIANQNITQGYHDGTGVCQGDADLAAGNIKSGVNLFGIAGDYPSATYPLPGAGATTDLNSNGTSITSANGAVEWWQSNGTRKAANLDLPSLSNVCSNETSNNSAGTLSVDADKIAVETSYCGTAGTLLANLYNGTGQGFDGGSQENGGVDDYNNAEKPPEDRYFKKWTECSVGNHYCDTDLESADVRDESTGLIWSLPCADRGCAIFDNGHATLYTWDSSGADNHGLTASELCNRGDHGERDWFLPHQKQQMQAYIDGSYDFVDAWGTERNYWSATTYSPDRHYKWYANLSAGSVDFELESNSAYVRCVRTRR